MHTYLQNAEALEGSKRLMGVVSAKINTRRTLEGATAELIRVATTNQNIDSQIEVRRLSRPPILPCTPIPSFLVFLFDLYFFVF
jgi:hypothetical protein